MLRPRSVALLLAFVTLAVYLPTGRFDFVNFDDNGYVTQNPFVKNGLTATDLRWAFTSGYASNWHPLTWISHMTDCELFHLNAGGHHLVSVLFHSANVALLFTLLLRLTRRIWPAAFVAALFAWHPVHVESVAWISERKDVLSTFFALLALLSHANYAELSKARSPKAKVSYGLSLLFFALGLMSKPMLVTLPFVMLLLDWWPLQRLADIRRIILEKIPFFALTAASCVITFIAQKQGGAVDSLARVPLHYRLENAPVAIVSYILKILWPVNLCAFYPMQDRIPALQVALSVAVLVVATAAAWHWRKTKPCLLTGWLWFLGTLVPVIGLVQVGGQAMADRYTYIPSIGFTLALVFLLADLAAQARLPKSISIGAALLVSGACILATEKQLPSWRDGETLYLRAMAVSPVNDIPLIEGGITLANEGRNTEALVLYRQAEKIAPERYLIHNNIGTLLSLLGRHAEALAEYRTGITLSPDNAPQHDDAGSELAALGRFNEALTEFAEAEKLDPALATPHFETGKVFFQQGRDSEGVKEFQTAVQLDPENYQTLIAVAHYLAASDDEAARDGKNAVVLALKANELSGQNEPAVFDILGMAFAADGDFTNAVHCTQNALNLANAAQLKGTGQIQARLDLYRKNLPWRESFRTTNAP